jgi:ATP-dependent RNA helicase RhlE
MRNALRAAGYTIPTPIQARAIAPALAGLDVIGSAQTGTGKTAAFVIPIVERLRADGGCAVVLAPTRELAEQTLSWAQRLGGGLRTALVVGGVPYGPQLRDLRNRPAIIVATPGRLVDHLERGTLVLRNLRIFVLDEADRMLDMGFKPQLDRIMQALPAPRQTLLFSATMPANLTALARMHLREPVRVQAGPQTVTPSRAEQDVYLVRGEDKTALLLSLIQQGNGTAGNMLVFARTKHRTDRLARALDNAGHSVQRIHADRTQAQRREALDGFRNGRYRILVATDIAARGIDVAGIERVINFDLPQTVDDYVHRIGRTARAHKDGHASSFAAPEERGQLHAIERHIGRPLQRQAVPSSMAAPLPSTHPRAHTPNGPAQRPASHHLDSERAPRGAFAARRRKFDNDRPGRPRSQSRFAR